MKTKDYTEKVLKHRKKPELALPVNEVHSLLKTEVLQNSKLDIEVSQYLTAILEYISMEILKVTSDTYKRSNYCLYSNIEIVTSLCDYYFFLYILACRSLCHQNSIS